MKNTYRLFVFLSALLLAPLAHAQTCVNTPNSGADFKVIDVLSEKEVFALCVGREVRFEDNSGRQLDPSLVLYAVKRAITCNPTDLNTTTTYTPRAADAGQVVITQNTQQAIGAAGIIYSKAFDVRAAPEPTFTLTPCSADFIQVTITDREYAANLYSIQIGDRVFDNVDRSQPATYTVPSGTTEITVTGRYAEADACSNSKTESFTPLTNPRQPLIQQLTVRAGVEIIFKFANLQAGYKYELQIGDLSVPGGYRTVARNLDGVDYYLTLTPNNDFLPGCYRIQASSACQGSAGLPASNPICTVDLGAVSLVSTSTNGQNKLNWSTLDPVVNTFQVRRDDRVIATLPGDVFEFVDDQASCGTTYTYEVVAFVDRAASVSNKVEQLTAAGQAPLPPRLVASFNIRNEVELAATTAGGVPLANELTFLRTSPTPVEVGVVNSPTITDLPLQLSVTNPPTYVARRRDACGSLSGDSDPAAPVVLAVDVQPEGALFTWSALVSPDPSIPVQYKLIRTALNGATIDAVPVTGLSYVDRQPPINQSTVRYRIEATGGGLATASFSNLVNVTQQPRLAMPTAFSPNGDGLNDVLEVKGRFLTTFLFTVIDRNGQEVFRGTDRTQTWNGRINGREPVPGTYAWRFESLTDEGKRFLQHGTITIVR